MLQISQVKADEDIQKCFIIREKVFVEGQKVPIEEELDGKDAESIHYLLTIDGTPAGVARVRHLGEFSKIERVAVLDEYQGQGLGRNIMEFILSDLQEHSGIKKAKLSSQVHAIPFYEKLGFKVCSEEYLDADIPHKDMELFFSNMSSSPI